MDWVEKDIALVILKDILHQSQVYNNPYHAQPPAIAEFDVVKRKVIHFFLHQKLSVKNGSLLAGDLSLLMQERSYNQVAKLIKFLEDADRDFIDKSIGKYI